MCTGKSKNTKVKQMLKITSDDRKIFNTNYKLYTTVILTAKILNL